MNADVIRVRALDATMPDGTTLVADAWHPAGSGPWPVLLQRLPYGRSVASTPVLPHPAWLAGHGYAVVVQDCRGRGDSGGTFSPFVNEGADGAASIEWASRLPFADGRVATYGFSYQGLAQLYAAAHRPPSLRAIAPMMCCPDPYEGWTYEGGLLRWPFVCFWSAQLAGQDLRTGPIPLAPEALPISAALGAQPPPWFEDWLAHPVDDAYWSARRPDLSAIDVPAFTVLGWFDDFSSGTARLAAHLGAELWCGPWAHMPWGTQHGGVELGPGASPAPVWDALLAFFDRVFGRDSGRAAKAAPRVRYYALGDGWHEAAQWPPHDARAEQWHGVSATGNANSRWGDGRLTPAPAIVDHPSTVVAQPLVPTPGEPFDYQDEAGLHDRRDLLCFTSDPLEHPLDLAGAPVAHATTRADRPRHDLVVTLHSVDPDGRAHVLTGSAQRITEPTDPGRELTWSIVLRPIAARVAAGHRIRLTIVASRFPCFDRNPHTYVHDPHTAAEAHLVATIEVGEVTLDLPVIDRSRTA